jgi:hypothetical protein
MTDVLISPTNEWAVPLHALAMFKVALNEHECKTGDIPTRRRFTDQELLKLIQRSLSGLFAYRSAA